MSDLQARLAALTPEQRARFERLLRERGRSEDRTTTFPLAVMQQGMWFLEQLRPGNPAYLMPGAVRMRGRLDTGALHRALGEIVRRHEALRTAFTLRDGQPVQVVHGRLDPELPCDDLRGRVADEAALADLVQAEALRGGLDLATGPLLRARLLRVADEDWVLVLTMHHLVSDRWSLGVLLTELSTLYESYIAGQPSPLPELHIQYGDFATWQQRRRADGHWAPDLAHWRGHLAGAPDHLDLPTDRPRPAVQSFNGASVPFSLTGPLAGELTDLAKRHEVTPYMAMLAVFQLLLHRWSGQDDLVVGVPVAVRDRPELEPVIGYFVNTLPIRVRLGGEPSFSGLLERVRDACLDAYAHQSVPFELIVAELGVERDLSRPPLCQVSFSYGREPVPALAMGGMELTRMALRSEGARFDLELQLFDVEDGVNGWFEYDRELFDEATVARLAGHFRRLAERVVREPDTPVAELELLDEAETRRTLAAGAGPETEWPGKGLIHTCFEDQARRTPEAPALRFEGVTLTYAELNRRANRLAHRLRSLGVGRDVPVGVAMHRSVELVETLLAVLKAGGAYLPLDPELPKERLGFMLADARVPVLLTRRDVLERLPETAAEVLCTEELDLGGEPEHDPESDVGGEDLAYVIYTSGSTGRPKGVQNVHAAIRNRLLWMQDAYGLTADDRVLQKTPFSFDVSVWEFFWPLMTGATLVVARPGGHRDPGYLARTIRAEAVTTVHFVPSMLQLFLREPGVEECTGLRRVVCSGEALPRDLAERCLDRLPAELHNLYGPTEAAVDVTAWPCRRDEDDPRPVPIGHPIANTRMYVLDERMRPVPTGVAGELHIGGRNLARGYLGRPELTAERFVDSPFDPPAPDGTRPRLYKTGDLARFRSDGALEFLGRLDHQVKLRGLRVELGEIEAELTRHERVAEAVVVTRPDAGGDQRLVAYVTGAGDGTGPGSGADVPEDELGGFLARRLPEYMVPSAFVVLPELPLSANGKVDRKALPEPELGRAAARIPYVAPRDELERTIAALWCELLGLEQVGAHDNFFDLGGHSLRMSELRLRLIESLGTEISMVELFQYPTVGSLAAHLGRPAADRAGGSLGARTRAAGRRRAHSQRQQAAARRARPRKQ
ncbi:amino acid adenylation domain-containing protein [Streptomyces sp. WMMC1477]|uniref:amino acid adenylation domain-containing protein n=1 Tax=Streptomyces sp. WMMC1477 TaxID=3015155 RepID=UPI0022B67544|nr:amino acid adenylation domain-containing protein [Streptomyces sp. WMMC1477]MCZ7431308.1 amino acid adenylation domain-containing protein [Streptomyces sp. WMMC1477]